MNNPTMEWICCRFRLRFLDLIISLLIAHDASGFLTRSPARLPFGKYPSNPSSVFFKVLTLNAVSVGTLIPEAVRDAKDIEKVLQCFSDWYSDHSERNNCVPKRIPLPSILSEKVNWMDCHYLYKPLIGVDAVERYLHLQQINLLGYSTRDKFVIDQVVVSEELPLLSIDGVEQSLENACIAVGFTFHMAEPTNGSAGGMEIPNRRGIVLLDLEIASNTDTGFRCRIVAAKIVREKLFKSGEQSLRILSFASRFLEQPTHNRSVVIVDYDKMTPPEWYFNAWNERDIESAVSVFAENISYDDTAFPHPIVGKENFRKHLTVCTRCFPSSFAFHIDRVLQRHQDSRAIVSWHVENGGAALPFTDGLSFYEWCDLNKTITNGIDFVDSESIKIATILDPMVALFRYEPIRLVPTLVWLTYMYVVFFSVDLIPGKNALQLEVRTWEEVRDLSLNFFLVAPILNLPFSPLVHPMLEGVFNVLLSWAALFAGFLSDDRRTKPNLIPMFPLVIGMQFLTSACLLPYLITRTPENELRNSDQASVIMSDLDFTSQVSESKLWGPILGVVGTYSIVWAFVGRWADFGDLSERWSSFIGLLSIDRVGSSFIVDLIIFACFQGWLVDEDLLRRGVLATESRELRLFAKFIPFFGLAAYLAFRPPFPQETDFRTSD